ncbi:hypothetical protein U1Q18_031643 [Sarracenia purpurea var. burkii]
MSGGVGPYEQEDNRQASISDRPQIAAASGGGFFPLYQLKALVVIVVLSASGLVSAEDFAFVVFSLIYIYFLSKVAFPTLSPSTEPPVFGRKNKALGLYVLAGSVVGLFLPIAYILAGVFEGDKEGIKAAAPHLFLLASQVFMEGLTFSGGFSLPIRVFVPVFYNSRRIFTILEWVRAEIWKDGGGSRRRLYVGRGIAIANLAFWCFNLFGFLLPVYLPRAFKRYYSAGLTQK